MAGNDLLANGQAQARPGHLAFGGLHPIEFLEEVRQGFDRDAHTGVANGERPLIIILPGSDFHQAIGRVVFYCITHQVEHHLFDFVAVGLHIGKISRDFKVQGNVTLIGLALHDLRAFIQQREQIEAGQVELNTPGFQAGQVKERGGQRTQAHSLAMDVVNDRFTLFLGYFRAQQEVGGRTDGCQRGA